MFVDLLKILLCLAILLIFLPCKNQLAERMHQLGSDAQDNRVLFPSQEILNCARIKGYLFLLASPYPAWNEILIQQIRKPLNIHEDMATASDPRMTSELWGKKVWKDKNAQEQWQSTEPKSALLAVCGGLSKLSVAGELRSWERLDQNTETPGFLIFF